MKFSKFLQSSLIRPVLAVRVDPGSSMMRTEGRCCPVGIVLYSIPVQRNWAHRTTGTSGDVPARDGQRYGICESCLRARASGRVARRHGRRKDGGMTGSAWAARGCCSAHSMRAGPWSCRCLRTTKPPSVSKTPRRAGRRTGKSRINGSSVAWHCRVVISGAETSTAPVQHVECDADFDAVVGQRAGQQFVGPGQSAQQGVAVGEQFAGGAGHVALLADEHSHC